MYITPISANNSYSNKFGYKGCGLKIKERIPVSLNPVKNITNTMLKKISIISQTFQYQIDPEMQRYVKSVFLQHSDKNVTTHAWDINKYDSKKYVIVLHGLSHNISCLQDVYKGIVDNTDYAVLAPEYTDICHPHKNRKTFAMKTIIDDSKASIDYLEKKGIKREDICIVGHSFGGYVGAIMAKELQGLGRFILISPTDSFKHRIYSIENRTNPIFSKSIQFLVSHSFFARWQIAHIYETNKFLSRVKCPIDIIYSSHDNLVKRETVEHLASASPNLSGLHILKKGSHRMDDAKIDAVISILNGVEK